MPVPLRGELTPREDMNCIRYLAAVIRQLNIPLVHVHGAKAGLVGRIAARLSGVRGVIYTVHNSIFYEDWVAWKRWLLTRAEVQLRFLTTRIITVSEYLRRELIEREGIEKHRVVTVHNGIDITPFHGDRAVGMAVRRELGIPEDAPVVGTVARLAPQKGVTYLIKALARLRNYLPSVRGVVVGDGPLREDLEREASEYAVPVTFTGYYADIPASLASFDVVAIPSVTEGLSLSVLEAMASARPVVAAAVGGLPEVILEGRTGLLVPPRDPEALSTALYRLLTRPAEAGRMGTAGRERVRQSFTLEKMVNRTREIYHQALGNLR